MRNCEKLIFTEGWLLMDVGLSTRQRAMARIRRCSLIFMKMSYGVGECVIPEGLLWLRWVLHKTDIRQALCHIPKIPKSLPIYLSESDGLLHMMPVGRIHFAIGSQRL